MAPARSWEKDGESTAASAKKLETRVIGPGLSPVGPPAKKASMEGRGGRVIVGRGGGLAEWSSLFLAIDEAVLVFLFWFSSSSVSEFLCFLQKVLPIWGFEVWEHLLPSLSQTPTQLTSVYYLILTFLKYFYSLYTYFDFVGIHHFSSSSTPTIHR